MQRHREELQSNDEPGDDGWLTLPPDEFEDYAVGRLMSRTLHNEFAEHDVFVRSFGIRNTCDRGSN